MNTDTLFTMEFDSLEPILLSLYRGTRLSDYSAHGKTIARVAFPTVLDGETWASGFDDHDRPVLVTPVTDARSSVIYEADVTRHQG